MKAFPSRANALKSAFEQHLQGSVVWLPEKMKIIEMPGDRAKGGYMEKYDTLELLRWQAFHQI